MEGGDDALADQLLDQRLSHVTGAAVAEALAGFGLNLLPGKDYQWLALAVRRALSLTIPHVSESTERTPDTKIRTNLSAFSRSAASTWLAIQKRDDETDSSLWAYAWRQANTQPGTDADAGNVLLVGDPPDYQRFEAAVAELDWLEGFLRRAAKATKPPKGRWTQSENKQLLITRGRYLAPIFEAAFGAKVTTNGYPDDKRHAGPTPYMEFLERIIRMAHGLPTALSLVKVAKAARSLHQREPVQFRPGLIPGLAGGGPLRTRE